jgi:hypothetical protein
MKDLEPFAQGAQGRETRRVLKFRAWNGASRRMTYLDPRQWSLTALAPEPFWEVMQFTGLQDKNGRDIYEGDLVVTSNDGKDGCDVWSAEEMGPATVTMDYHGVHMRDKSGFGWSWDEEETIYSLGYCEVIGNIYEAPQAAQAAPEPSPAEGSQS